MKKKLNVGLIGIGRLGSMYAEYLRYRVPRANLVALADIIPERAQKGAERLDLPYWFDNHHDLNACKEVDAVVVTATTVNHKEIVIDAAREGKSIFCEKPMTLDLADARAMKQEIERRGIFYQQGFQRRFDKGFAAAKRKLEEGVIGKPVMYRGSSRDPYPPSLEYLKPVNSGGQIIDMAIHDIDLARWYLGEIESVFAIGAVLAFPEIETIHDTDNVVMVFSYENRAIGEIDISRNGVYGYDIRAEVLGTDGAIKAGYLQETPIFLMTKEGVSHDTVAYFPERFGEAYVKQLTDYVDNIIEGRPPMLTADDGIAALQVAVAATAALHERKLKRVKDF